MAALIDWQRYLLRSDLGAPLLFATVEQFVFHLQHVQMLLTRGLPYQEVGNMSAVDWASIIEEHTNAKGAFDEKAATDWFKGEIKAQVKRVADEKKAATEFEENMVSALHATFGEANTDILPRDTLINYAMRRLNVPISQAKAAYERIEKYLGDEKNGFFGVILGPHGGTIRCRDEQDKETAAFKANKNSVRFGAIIRTRTPRS